MKILMIAHYVTFPSEGGNNRFCYILDLLKNNKQNKLELITSDFRHATKEKHKLTKYDIKKLGYNVTLIHEPKYKANISIKRLLSARKLANNTKKYLESLKEMPDVIYCAVPSLDLAKVATKFAKKNKIRLIIDIQDLWPEAFKMVFNIPLVSNLVFYPMKKAANYIYASADEIIAVSQSYVDIGLKVNKKAKGISVYLGTDLQEFYRNANNPSYKKYSKFTIVYIGTLGHSYDLDTTIEAVGLLKQKGNDVNLLIMGDGPLRAHFVNHAKKIGISYEFTGKLPYQEMCHRLSMCHVAINPIKKGAAQSIINKHGDYAISGIPVLSTQERGEYSNLIEKYKMGYVCKNEDVEDLAKKILVLYKKTQLRVAMGNNAKKCGEECFDRRRTYKQIKECILQGK